MNKYFMNSKKGSRGKLYFKDTLELYAYYILKFTWLDTISKWNVF